MPNNFFWFGCLIFILANIIDIKGLETVNLVPTLCGTTSMRVGCQIILAHMGVAEGMSVYMDPVNCVYIVQAAAPNQRIRFSVGTGENEVNAIMHDMGCMGAALEVFDTDGTTTLATLCNGVIDRTEYESSGDRITLNLRSMGGNSSILNFTAHVTSFSEEANCASDPSFFPCANGRCVDPAGRCDTTLINNCGDFSDNSPGPPGNCSSEDETTTPTTISSEVTTTTVATAAGTSDLWIIGAAVGGLIGAYFLYWLLWRPGYLVWRCSCWRHWCKSAANNTNPSKGPFTDTKSKPSDDFGSAKQGQKPPPNKGDKGTAMHYLSDPKNGYPTNGASSYDVPGFDSAAHNGPPGYSTGVNDIPNSDIYGITREAHIFR